MARLTLLVLQNQALLNTVRQFWTWWTGELERSIPQSLLRYFASDTTELLVRMEHRVARLELRTPKEQHLLAVIDLENDDDAKLESVRMSVLSKLPDNLKVSIFLPSDKVLVREVMLPQATEPNLAGVLKFELDRFAPFPSGQASFGYRLLARYPEHEKIKVELAVVRQDYLDKVLHRIRSLGLAVSAVYPRDLANERTVASLNMLSPERRPSREGFFDPKARNLAITAAVLLLLACFYPSWQLNHVRDSLEERIDAIRKEAMVVGAKQSLLASRVGAQDVLADRKNNVPGKLQVLQEITHLLPDNTWVSHLNIDNTGVTLQGESGKASNLIELLEKSDYFQNVTFGSSLTRNPSTNKERYEIRMELVAP